jgi:hypothetical protein
MTFLGRSRFRDRLRSVGGETFALDAIGQSAVDLHYGLRRVFTAYAGPACRVVRTSDSAEADFGFVGDSVSQLSVASNATAGNNLTLDNWRTNNGANPTSQVFIVTMYDHSGNGRHATQLNSLHQPRLMNSSGVLDVTPVTTTNRPGFFGQVTRGGGTNGFVEIPSFTTTSTGPYTCVDVCYSTINNPGASWDLGDGANWYAFTANSVFLSLMTNARIQASPNPPSNYALNQMLFFTTEFTGSVINFEVYTEPNQVIYSGIVGSPGTFTSTPSVRRRGSASGNPNPGYSCEWTAFKRLLTQDEKDELLANQQAAWL